MNSQKETYDDERDHLNDYLEMTRLLLGRHIVRHWHRLVDSSGQLSDLFVSLIETRFLLAGQSTQLRPPQELELNEARSIKALASFRARMLDRLAGTPMDGHLTFPIENLRAYFELEPLELDLVMVLASLQVEVDLARLARFAWADFTVTRPTLGFLSELLADDRDQRDALMALAAPDSRLRRLELVTFHAAPGISDMMTPVSLPGRLLDYVLGRSGASQREGLHHWCHSVERDRTLSDLGRSPQDKRRFISAITMAGERSGPQGPRVMLTGLRPGALTEIALACLPPRSTALRITPTRSLGRAPLEERVERLERRLVLGLREAKLRDAIPVICLDHDEEEALYADTLQALEQALPRFDGLILVATWRASPRLRGALRHSPEVMWSVPDTTTRLTLWRRALGLKPGDALERALVEVSSRYALDAGEIRTAAQSARVLAQSRSKGDGQPLVSDLHQAIRHETEHQLGLLAEPFSTDLTWDDLILEPELKAQLNKVVAYASNEHTVNDLWGFGRLNPQGRGFSALFAGPPGTGKTLSAAIIAKVLRYDLFRIDLSRIVNKYIGETEKNLARVFDEAERSRAILLFDEADSLFAKRTEVSSSNDRYANLEVNFLLQRMEIFDGITILTTNLADQLDEAFQRRIKFKLHFKLPALDARLRLWKSMIPPEAPVADELDLELLASSFEMAPGHIKNAVLAAAFEAATEGTHIQARHLHQAALAEYKSLGKLVRSDELP